MHLSGCTEEGAVSANGCLTRCAAALQGALRAAASISPQSIGQFEPLPALWIQHSEASRTALSSESMEPSTIV